MTEMTDEERVTDGIVRDLESCLANKDAFISALTSYVRHLEAVLADRDAQIAELKAPKTPERRRAYMREYMKKRRGAK